MAVSTRDKKTKANLKERISNIYENTKFTFRNSGKKNTQAVPTIVYMNNDPQEEYDEVTMSTCNQKKPSSTSRKKSKPNNYTSWNDRKTGCSNTSVKGVYENAQRASIQLPTHASKLPTQVTIKWKFLSIIALIFCICLITALVSLVILIFQQKVSPCEGIGCLYNGTCSVSDDDIVCRCLKGFSGAKCEVTPCEIVKCGNGGECFLQNLKPKCSCRNGFSGVNCSVTPCSGKPCDHNGQCTYNISSPNPHCECPDGFYGDTCEVTPCSSVTCMNNGSCTYRTDSPGFKCNCSEGYSGRNCEVTPCTHLPCENNGKCTVIGSGYKCKCLDGFVGENCTDVHCDFETVDSVFSRDLWDTCSNWTRHSGSTPSSWSGPSGAQQGNYYMYFESSVASCVRMVSRTLKLDSTKCITFYYHMFGHLYYYNVGELNVYIGKQLKWNKSGNQGTSWHFVNITVTSTVSQITFYAGGGSSGHSDIAIDDVKITKCQ